MKRILPVVLMLGLATAYGCKDKSDSSPKKAATDPGATGDPNTPGNTPGTSEPPTEEEKSTNPIDGIEAPTAILEAGEFTDGPVWHAGVGALFFTTPLGEGALYRMLPDGRVLKILDGVSKDGTTPIGNTVTAAGDLITVDAKRVVKMVAAAGDPKPIATGYPAGGAPPAPAAADAGDQPPPATPGQFDTLNDVVARKDGTLYVTDPGYFTKDLVANRIYRIDPQGKVQVVEAFEDVPRPNGIALAPDEKSLYVGFTDPVQGTLPFIRKYTVNDDGTLGEWVKFLEIGPADSKPDGLAVDKVGNLYVATKAGIEVYKPDGKPWGTIQVPEKATGITFGGEDMKTLYITTEGVKIWQVKTKLAGISE